MAASTDEHATDEHATDGGAPNGEGGSEIEAEYTPRRLPVDEEDCDDVAREALAHLRGQAQTLAERQKELTDREQAIKASERAQVQAAAQVEERIKELVRLSGELDERLSRGARSGTEGGRSTAGRAERVKSVSRMVSGMTAQRAATLLGEFKDDELAVEVLQSLPQEVAGKVLGQMRPTSAARLAERIGGGDREGAKP